MAEWSRNKVESSAINGGKEFTTDDVLTVKELNSMVNNSFYGVDFVEAMATQPDISEIDGLGNPNVSLVSNGKFKKFKFSNIKGANGSGIYYSNAVVNNNTVFHDTITNTTHLLNEGDLILSADAYLYQVVFVNLAIGGVTSYQVQLMANQFKGSRGDRGVPGPKGEKGDVGATFSYDESTKTLNIITE